MIIPLDVKCVVCSKVFCCAKCRQKHEIATHQQELKILEKCPICNGRQYILEKIVANREVYEHVMVKHLPLHCNKCEKVFHKRSDFTQPTKCDCMNTNKNSTQTLNENKENHNSFLVISSDSALKIKKVLDDDSSILTPLSKWNLKWRRKSSDYHSNVSSIKRSSSLTSSLNKTNASHITGDSSVGKSTESPKQKKLTRSTSTPMQQMLLVHKSVTFDSLLAGSSCQVSSIACTTVSDSDAGGAGGETADKVYYRMPKNRPRIPVSATPLHLQLMSKSVQRAIAAHGQYEQYYKSGIQRKMMFDSTSSNGSISGTTSIGSPLDLRTTPVLRRTQSEFVLFQRRSAPPKLKIPTSDMDSELAIPLDDSPALILPTTNTLFDPQKTRRRSSDLIQHLTSLPEADQSELVLNATMTDSEIYETCEDFDQVSSAKTSYGHLQKTTSLEVLYVTPKPVGGLLKKAISFNTPEQMSTGFTQESIDNESPAEMWYTPSQGLSMKSKSCSTLVNETSQYSTESTLAKSCEHSSSSDDVFHAESSCEHNSFNNGTKPIGKLWNIVTSVFRLASGGGSLPNIREAEKKATATHEPKTIAQRAASFAGFFRSQSSGNLDESPVKRRRTSSSSGPTNVATNCYKSPKAKRRKRIQGRQPIRRMKNNVC